MASFFFRGAAAALLFALLTGPVAALELLVVERPNCPWCRVWNAQIAPVYPRSAEGRLAPLYRADVSGLPPGVAFREPVLYTPTFVLIENNREIGRITGYATEEEFWTALDGLLDERARRLR